MSAAAAVPLPGDAADLRPGPLLRLRQLLAVMQFFVRINLGAKRLWIVGLLLLLPTLVPLSYRIIKIFAPEIGPIPPAMMLFQGLVAVAYLRVGIYILALVYGLAIVSDEVESKTLVHLLLRPIPRWTLVVGKFLAAWLLTGVILVVSVALTYALLFAVQDDPVNRSAGLLGGNLKTLLITAVLLLLALGAYLAFFSTLGAWLAHGERWGVVFAWGWESLITYLPARLKWLTIMYHLQTLFPYEVSTMGLFRLQGEPLSKPSAIGVILAVMIASLALTIWNVKRREIK